MADSTDRTESKREYYPLRTVDVLAIVVFWALLGFISTVSRELDPRVPGIAPRVQRAVELATYVEYALWACLALPIWWLASRYSVEGGRRLGRILLFVLLGIGVAIAMDALLVRVREAFLFDAIDGRPRGPRRRPVPAPLGLGFLDDLMVYFAVLGAGVARDYFLRYRKRLEETARLQQQLAQARLDALRTQLNPHFLFNTLNAVSALVDRDARGARRMIARLSDLLRYTLDESTGQEVPLRRELDLLGEYVDLMQIRFQGKLAVETRVDDDVRDALVPNLILQPLVENAVKHGVGRLAGGGRISIRARRDRVGETDALILTVTDNGPGPGGGEEGVGLTNTNARLRQMYGDAYHVVLRPATQSGGTEAEIAIPYHTATSVARAS
ncbi:MAG TPA: histidine kinase [Gemmatimonadaceae bacterium]|nr:histidine kinase [Gemmatimonadaceae bacterium]